MTGSSRPHQESSVRAVRGAVVAGIVAVHVGLVAWSAAWQSPVVDEPAHLVSGVAHRRFGRFKLYNVNPPLVRMVASLPLDLAGGRYDWRNYESTSVRRTHSTLARDFLDLNGLDSHRLFVVARWSCVPFTVVGSVVCYCWARELYGHRGGLLALLLWCFSPNILAHASLITPDLGAAALGLAAGYSFWKWLTAPGWKSAVCCGVVLGLAELTKTTWIMLFALWPAVWLFIRLLRRHGTGTRSFGGEAAQLATLLLISVNVVNLGYGFEGSFRRLGDFEFISATLSGRPHSDREWNSTGNQFRGTVLAGLAVPFPENYIMGIDEQKADFERGMASYLRGQWRDRGWWHYYLYALLIKVPLGTWSLLILAVLLRLPAGVRSNGSAEILLVATPLTIVALVSSQTGFNHHMRYVLPALPFVFVRLGSLARYLTAPFGRVSFTVCAALAWTIGDSLFIYPHSLSYFNELVGGPRNGHAHLVDSNVDWGQDLLFLKSWIDGDNDGGVLFVDYYGFPRLATYGIACVSVKEVCGITGRASEEALSARLPDSVRLAVSVNRLRSRDGRYESLIRRRPEKIIGFSIYIFRMTRRELIDLCATMP